MEDIKGISPTLCMHKILLEENSKNSIESQRRLNPIMKEVLKKKSLSGQMLGLSTQFLTVCGLAQFNVYLKREASRW